MVSSSPSSLCYVRRYADAGLEACWLVVAALVPLYVDSLRSQPGLARGLLLQVLATFMAILWLVQWVAARKANAAPQVLGVEHDAAKPSYPAFRVQPFALLVALAAAYAGSTLLAALLAPLPAVALWGSYLRGGGAFADLGYMVLFLVVADRLRTRAQLDRLVTVLLAASLLVCLNVLAQAPQLALFWQQGAVRVASTAGNPIFLAAYLILLVPLTVWRLLDVDPRREAPGHWTGLLVLGGTVVALAVGFGVAVSQPQGSWAVPALLAAFALGLGVLPARASAPWAPGVGQRVRQLGYLGLLLLQLDVIVLTASRGPVLALVAALVVVTAVAAWQTRRWRRLLVVGGLVLVLGGGLAILLAPSTALSRLVEGVPLLKRFAALGQGETVARVVVWRLTAEALLASPERLGPLADPLGGLRLLIGYGPESVVYLLNRVLPPASELDVVAGEFWDRSHNALLDRLLTTGLLGLAAYLALVGAVLGVVFRRVLPTRAPLSWGLYAAFGVALLGHLIESQSSMLILPGEAVFWLLAGMAVSPVRLDGAGARVAAPAAEGVRCLPVVLYAAAVVLAVWLLGQLPPPGLLVATVLALLAVLVAPLAGALALAPPAASGWMGKGGIEERGIAAGWAFAVIGLASGLALLLSSHQVGALAADVAFRRAELAQYRSNFSAAITAAQEALRLAPDQAEYYYVLGQYYAALGGSTPTPPAAGFAPTPAAVLSAQPGLLGRDQLFALGRLSLDEAVRRNPLEARYYATRGELYRYWAEVAKAPEHLPDALASFQRATALKPNDVEVQAGIADALLLGGDSARALEAARRAVALLPTYWYPYAVEGRAALASGNSTEALLAAGQALRYASVTAGQKNASASEQDRLRKIIAQAIASGQTPVQPDALVRNDYSGATYRIDDELRKRLVPTAAALAACGYPPDAVQVLPDPVVAWLPTGPDLTGC